MGAWLDAGSWSIEVAAPGHSCPTSGWSITYRRSNPLRYPMWLGPVALLWRIVWSYLINSNNLK